MLQYTADKSERVDKFLAPLVEKSRGAVQKAIKSGLVTVNGEAISESDFKIKPGDVIVLPEFKDFELIPSDRELNVVYEDSDMAVIDKPAGLVVHPGAGNTEDTLSNALLTRFPGIESVGEKHRPGIVHRLDEDTSGLLLIAKTPAAYDFLKQMFKDRQVDKEYTALVHGIPAKLHDIINAPLEQNFAQRKISVRDGSASGGKVGNAKEAITEYSVAKEIKSGAGQFALINVKLHTGRTHQIRAHMAHIGHPLVGDKLYGGTFKSTDKELLDRQFLHAHRLKFQKMDGVWIELNSELPDDLKTLLNKLKN